MECKPKWRQNVGKFQKALQKCTIGAERDTGPNHATGWVPSCQHVDSTNEGRNAGGKKHMLAMVQEIVHADTQVPEEAAQPPLVSMANATMQDDLQIKMM